jgi:hypothetical protein
MVDTVTGAAIFVVIAVVAALINLLVQYLESLGIDGPVALALIAVEYTLLFADVVLFVVFIWRVVSDAIFGRPRKPRQGVRPQGDNE